MLLRKISLENYGLYSNKIEFDLVPRTKNNHQKSIVLFGGKNGAGKTTILEAVQHVFYGKGVLGNRVSQKEYDDFLVKKIHRGSEHEPIANKASIAIEFEHVAMGESTIYKVERSWSLNKSNKPIEHLKILSNDKLIENVTPDYWKGFIEETIPERLSQLFFFDGEKIKSIAEENTNNYALAESIKMLLGLDIVERLKADLKYYTESRIKESSTSKDREIWERTESNIKKIKHEIEDKIAGLGSNKSRISGVLSELRSKEIRLRHEGHVFANRRESLKETKSKLFSSIETIEAQIRTECEKTFPLSLCPTISNLLCEQIEKEIEIKHQRILSSEVKNIEKDLLSAIENNEKVSQKAKAPLKEIIQDTLRKRTDIREDLIKVEEIFNFSEPESRQLIKWIEDSKKISKQKINELSQTLGRELLLLRKANIDLAKSPQKPQLQPLFDELSLFNQKLGELQQDRKHKEEDLRKKENELKTLQRELNKLIDLQISQKGIDNRVLLVSDIQSALSEYQERLTAQKIKQLRKAVAEKYNSLSRKGKMIEYIEIDPRSFEVTLFDISGNEIPKDSLSSGEKQLYAISMLWGLAVTSGRPLPVIIDTPLGRLDSDHRNNLIDNYFPNASHQIIILSTDTEIDQKLYEKLGPEISHCYHLEYDKKTNSTHAKEKYFWREQANA